jgi:hypothetical protein
MVLVVLLSPAAAFADRHKIEVLAAVSYTKGSHLFGFHIFGGMPLGDARTFTESDARPRFWTAFVDFSLHFGSHRRYTLLVGPRYASVNPAIPSGQVGAGFQWDGKLGNTVATAIGVGWTPLPWKTERETASEYGTEVKLRVQTDLIFLDSTAKPQFRLSAGPFFELKRNYQQ